MFSKKSSSLIVPTLFALTLSACSLVPSTNKLNSKNNSSNYSSDTYDSSNYDDYSHDPQSSYPVSGNKAEVLEAANNVNEQICEEGMILLKNDNLTLPLREQSKVSIFGKNSVNLVYGGSGSAAPTSSTPNRTIYDSLESVGFSCNPVLKAFYENDSMSGSKRSMNPLMDSANGQFSLKTGETPISSYTDNVKFSYDDYSDAALVVISRIGGENWDLPRIANDNQDRHYLELDNNERALIQSIGESGQFQSIILLINSSNNIDLGFLNERNDAAEYNSFGKYVNAVINIGTPGARGIMALGRILSGEVNPSGKTVDTYYTNYEQDPTWQNFGGNSEQYGDTYLTQNGKYSGYYTVEYEENIYMGYRYYETRGRDNPEWYDANVVYPFGYGLSYTAFVADVVNKTELQSAQLSKEQFEVKVQVRNVGSVSGKQVVQLYAEAPYINGGIEKAYKVLVGFAKTKVLQPGAQEIVSIIVDPYHFASFDSKDKNGNALKAYELEAGNYTFHLGFDAHNDIDTFTKSLSSHLAYELDPITNVEVGPLFSEETEHMSESLSRSDFVGTFPHAITTEERTVSDEFIRKLKSYASTNDEEYTSMPTTGANNGLALKDLMGLDYTDPKWDSFLDQLTFDEMLNLFNDACYQTTVINRLGVPRTISFDGPNGIVSFLGEPAVYDTCYYCSECLLAQTYNLDLAALEGNAIGDECLVGDVRSTGLPYTNWYAPAMNLHRSPFCGRNSEYFSEDPLLSGKFAASLVSSVQEKGVNAFIKHFALNDQETHRSANGLATWCDEQAIRELYLKPFEHAVKEGKAKGVASSFNRIGTEWTGGSYRLLTKVLRNEWGFVGAVTSDFHTDKYMDSKQMLYAGGDLNLVSTTDLKLAASNKYDTPYVSQNDAKDVSLLRRAAHNVLYIIANSNAMKYM